MVLEAAAVTPMVEGKNSTTCWLAATRRWKGGRKRRRPIVAEKKDLQNSGFYGTFRRGPKGQEVKQPNP